MGRMEHGSTNRSSSAITVAQEAEAAIPTIEPPPEATHATCHRCTLRDALKQAWMPQCASSRPPGRMLQHHAQRARRTRATHQRGSHAGGVALLACRPRGPRGSLQRAAAGRWRVRHHGLPLWLPAPKRKEGRKGPRLACACTHASEPEGHRWCPCMLSLHGLTPKPLPTQARVKTKLCIPLSES